MAAFNISYSIPYILIFFVLCFLYLFEHTYSYVDGNKKNLFSRNITDFFCLSVLILFFSFRGYVCFDWINYKRVFDDTPNFLENDFSKVLWFINNNEFDKLFALLYVLIRPFSDNYLIFQTVLSVFDIIILYKLFKYYLADHWIFGFFTFLVFGGLNYAVVYERNFQSLLIFIYSIRYMKKGSYPKYFLLNLFGFFFHASSFVYFFLPIFIKKVYNKNIILFLIIAGFGIKLVHFPFSLTIVKLFTNFLPGRLRTMATAYISYSMYNVSYAIRLGDIERFLTFFIFYKYSKKINTLKGQPIFINCFYLYSLIYLYCSDFSILVGRMSQLFIFSYWFLYAELYKNLRKNGKILILFFLLFYGTLKIYQGTYIYSWFYDNWLFNSMDSNERQNLLRKIGVVWQG